MLTDAQLLQLLADLESDRVERTVSVSDTDKFCQAVCAFSNDLPNHNEAGYLLIGVRDDGTPSGLEVSDELLQKLGAIRADGNVLPSPAMNVQKYRLNGGEIAVVEVTPSDMPPVRYKGRVYIRVGPRKAVANEQEERILSERRTAAARCFDTRPCTEANLKHLALGQFDTYRREAVDAETIATNHRDIQQQLASLRMYDLERNCPTFAGILLFGKTPRYFLSGAYIQYLKFSGTDFTYVPEDQAEIEGDLSSMLRELELRIKTVVQTSMRRVSALQEELVPDYPEWALREFLMNAVMHRNYESNTPIHFYVFSDRVEVQSAGGLYGEATNRNFPMRNSYRNPVIAEAMKSLGFINRFGYGVQRAQIVLKENGNPPAQFEFDGHTVLVKIYRRTT
ncbi:MAG: RNA-binding domain-containing protein [Gallionella sp.]